VSPSNPTFVYTPDWVRDAIFYQIFPDRFARSTRLTKPQSFLAGAGTLRTVNR
jgi:hypothetical protein